MPFGTPEEEDCVSGRWMIDPLTSRVKRGGGCCDDDNVPSFHPAGGYSPQQIEHAPGPRRQASALRLGPLCAPPPCWLPAGRGRTTQPNHHHGRTVCCLPLERGVPGRRRADDDDGCCRRRWWAPLLHAATGGNCVRVVVAAAAAFVAAGDEGAFPFLSHHKQRQRQHFNETTAICVVQGPQAWLAAASSALLLRLPI